MKPCERKRASSRWATRCSRWRWTVSSVITPSSSKTTGRTLASRRHSVELLIGRPGRAERVERRRPARVGPGPAVERREAPAAVRVPGCERRGAEQLERAGQRVAERRRPRTRSTRASARAASGSGRSARAGRPGARAPRRAPRRRRACAPASRSARSISPARRSTSAWRMPWRRRRSMSSSITCERLPSSRLIVSVLRTSTSSTRSSARWGSTK